MDARVQRGVVQASMRSVEEDLARDEAVGEVCADFLEWWEGWFDAEDADLVVAQVGYSELEHCAYGVAD